MNRLAFWLAMVSVVCVLAVFFFPSVQGPYSAVHGPVTVMHAARAAAGVRMAVERAALTVFHTSRAGAVLILLHSNTIPGVDFQLNSELSGFVPSLRC
jgi:hypothetical protein